LLDPKTFLIRELNMGEGSSSWLQARCPGQRYFVVPVRAFAAWRLVGPRCLRAR
jgi:hypothetical protein